MVQVDFQIACLIQDIAERIFDFGFAAVWASEIVIAHRRSGVAISVDAIAFPAHIGPAFDRKAAIFGAFSANEIG